MPGSSTLSETEAVNVVAYLRKLAGTTPTETAAGDPKKGELGRRYSNFGHYVDRKTGEFVLLVAEEPRVTWDDYWSDTIRFSINLKG